MKSQIVGKWDLIYWKIIKNQNGGFYPMGQDVKGLLIYDSDDFVSMIIQNNNRLNFKDDSFILGTDLEKIDAFNTCISYVGRYEIGNNQISHHILISSYPNWNGQTKVRDIELSNNQLLLKTRPRIYLNDSFESELLWSKHTI